MNPDVRLSEHAVPACLVNLVRRVPPAPHQTKEALPEPFSAIVGRSQKLSWGRGRSAQPVDTCPYRTPSAVIRSLCVRTSAAVRAIADLGSNLASSRSEGGVVDVVRSVCAPPPRPVSCCCGLRAI